MILPNGSSEMPEQNQHSKVTADIPSLCTSVNEQVVHGIPSKG